LDRIFLNISQIKKEKVVINFLKILF